MRIVEQIKLRKKLLKIIPSALEEYRTTVKGNAYMPKIEVRKKLTRNVILGELSSDKDGIKTYHYGNLIIAVEDKKVVAIRNHKGNKFGKFNKDVKRYYELNRELQIKEN